MNQDNTRVNPTVLNSLAIIGFVSLVGAGVWLAVLGARYVPEVVNRSGLASVYLGSLFNPAPEPAATTTPPGTQPGSTGNATSTATSTRPSYDQDTSRRGPIAPIAGSRTYTTLPVGTSSPALHGLPDLEVTIQAVGYLVGPTTDSFVASTTVPAGARPAVRFTIKNIGTNSTGPWRFSAMIPTQSNFLFQSVPQQSLNPSDRIEYTLGFDQPLPGVQTITIRANFDNAVAESKTTNNVISAQLTIRSS